MSKNLLDETMSCLYRGVGGIELDDVITKALTPKKIGIFSYSFNYDGVIRHDGSATYGENKINAVLRHQLNQEGWPTAGISTTPHKDRARFYAMGKDGCHKEGIILTINRLQLSQHGVMEAVVSATVHTPSEPKDDEVILFDNSGGSLPSLIVIKIERVTAE
jgi:hypothetical protein